MLPTKLCCTLQAAVHTKVWYVWCVAGGEAEAQAAYEDAMAALADEAAETHRHMQSHTSKKSGRTKWTMMEMWPMLVLLHAALLHEDLLCCSLLTLLHTDPLRHVALLHAGAEHPSHFQSSYQRTLVVPSRAVSHAHKQTAIPACYPRLP